MAENGRSVMMTGTSKNYGDVGEERPVTVFSPELPDCAIRAEHEFQYLRQNTRVEDTEDGGKDGYLEDVFYCRRCLRVVTIIASKFTVTKEELARHTFSQFGGQGVQ